jgi:hypothetical protein
MGCVYCAEAAVKLSGMKAPTRVVDEIAGYSSIYGEATVNPYFESSYFRPTSEWIAGLRGALDDSGLRFAWRTETRVDALSPAQVAQLARTGLKVLDLGLESASKCQLLAMEKTPAPDVYLRRASELLQACADNGVWTKVNFLLFPGETSATVNESCEWLERHRSLIKGVSASPTIVYRYGPETSTYVERLALLGACPVDANSLDAKGYSDLHMSDEIDNASAVVICRAVSRNFMTARDYFELKAFSYFPRGFSWTDFMSRISETDQGLLSFSMPQSGTQSA